MTCGTVIWTLPSGQTYVTTPGSALLFPSLCAPTGELPPPEPAHSERCGDKTAKMPLRTTTRAQNRAHYIAAERHRNQQARQHIAEQRPHEEIRITANDEPPPF